MERDTRRVVGFVTSQFVFIAALVHLSLGVVNWLRWLQAGVLVPRDARWPVFVLSGFAILVGTFYGARAENRRPFYAAGIVVMLGYVLAYFGWHLGGHRLLLVVGRGAGAPETLSVQWFLDHLFAGPVEFVSIVVETLGAAGLAVLFVTSEDRVTAGDDPG
jgi:hypothetical protein